MKSLVSADRGIAPISSIPELGWKSQGNEIFNEIRAIYENLIRQRIRNLISTSRKFRLNFRQSWGFSNLTPDSFSDGGLFLEPERAWEHAHQMVEEGLGGDLGAEARRSSSPISEQEEWSRILPVVEKLSNHDFVLSLDTTKPAVAQAGLQAGVHLINDVSGGAAKTIEFGQPVSIRFRRDALSGKAKDHAG